MAQNYCTICQRLFTQAKNPRLFPDVISLLTDKGYEHNKVWGPGCSMCKELRQLAGIGDEERERDTVILKAFAEEGDPAAEHFPLRPVATDLSDDAVFEALKSSIRECQESHGRCQTPADKPTLPRRVVMIGNGSDRSFRVHESSQNERDDYATLSYCWGHESTYRATTENMAALRAGLDVSVLPQTLQDAMEVTRRLGYKYLWVDALCILQDSAVDKDREIELMGSIYRDATVTIAAAGASGCHEGFLRAHRSPSESLKTRFPLGGSIEGTISLVLKPQPIDINMLPLGRRGWAFQEFFLSQKTIIFAPEQVLWLCRKKGLVPLMKSVFTYLDTIDQLPNWLDDVRQNFEADRMYMTPNTFETRETTGKVPEYQIMSKDLSRVWRLSEDWEAKEEKHMQTRYTKQCCLWKSIVSQYTARALAEPEDRLRALQGVAQQLQKLWQARYVFGIWQNAWPELLAWIRVGPAPQSPRQWHRAPSWSWASLDCQVSFLGYSQVPMDIYEVEGGSFNVKGVFDSDSRATWFAGPSLCFRARLLPYQRIGLQGARTIVFDLDNEPRLELFCVPLGRLRFIGERSYLVGDGEDRTASIYFLIVSRVRANAYQRVGAGQAELTEEEWARLTQEFPRQEVCL